MLSGRGDRQELSLLGEYTACVPNGASAAALGLQREAQLQLERAARMKSDFISQMSHELRTPLNAVIGFSKLIRGHCSHPLSESEIVSYADLIHTAACELLTFVNDVLELSKLQSGSCVLMHDDVAICAMLSELADDARRKASGKNIEVRLDTCAELLVDGDAGRIRRALSSLIDNAVRFTPEGGKVKIAATMGEGHVTIGISDTGVGMTDQEIASALAPFGVAEWRSMRAGNARGLGLPLAMALVRAHGGELEIASEEGKGTHVSVSLPAVAASDAQVHCAHAATA